MGKATTCWRCGNAGENVLFCASCGGLQPPVKNYFDFFGLDHKLTLDTKELERRFYALSRQLHPDVFFRRSPEERQFSLDATAILNDAYRALKDPVSRAEYLLKEHGFDIGEQKSNHVPPELLEEVFELNMALENASGRPQLEEALGRFSAMREDADTELEAKFDEYDRTRSTAVLAEIRGILNRRKYIRNLVNQVEEHLRLEIGDLK